MAPCAARTLRKRFPGPRACSCEDRLLTERAGASSVFDFLSFFSSSSELRRRSPEGRVRLTAEPRFSSEASLAVRALARFLGWGSSSADSSSLRLRLFEAGELSRERDLATTLRSRLGGETSFSSRRRRSVFSFLPPRGTSFGSLRLSCLVFFFFFLTSSSEDPLSLAFEDLLDTTFFTLTLALSARELAALLVFSRRRLFPSLFFFFSSFFVSSFFESFFDSFFFTVFTGDGDGDGDSAPEPLEASELLEEGSGAFDLCVELRAGGTGVDFWEPFLEAFGGAGAGEFATEVVAERLAAAAASLACSAA